MKTSYTEVSVKLQDIIITDMNPDTIHPTVRYIFNFFQIDFQTILQI